MYIMPVKTRTYITCDQDVQYHQISQRSYLLKQHLEQILKILILPNQKGADIASNGVYKPLNRMASGYA